MGTEGLPLVSVVIASHRGTYLPGLLTALRNCRDIVFETIAVCDYDPGKITPEFKDVRFITLKTRSISAKRNAGVRLAAADIIAFIDDDCIPAPDWVKNGATALMDSPDCSGIEGFTAIENSPGTPPPLRDYRRLEQRGYRTNNIFYRKPHFLEVGGFDERFTVQREDIDLAFSILDKGHAIGYDPAVQVTHRVRKNEPWDLLKNCVNRRFDPLLYKKHPARYREHIRTPFPTSLLLLLVFHGTVVATFFLGVPFFIPAVVLADFAAVTILAHRRRGGLVTEWLASFCAPVALFGALVYGSVRYGKLLLV